MLLVAAALALAVVLTLAGVLGQVLLIELQPSHQRMPRSWRLLREWPERGCALRRAVGAAEEAGESRGQSEVAYSVGLHEEFLFFGWSRRCARKLSLTRYSWPETGVEVLFPCRMFEA